MQPSSYKNPYRDKNIGEISDDLIGQTLRLAGFINTKRDHGGLLFIELRDHYGQIQCVIDCSHENFSILESLRIESSISIEGVLEQRSSDTINANIALGYVELKISKVNVLTSAEVLPFSINSDESYPEDLRLKYRYLDLRNDKLHQRMITRSKIIHSFRERMIELGFIEIQTPILTASSPEGARDFLVPSRMYPGKFYALPQAPQQFKQLLMIANYDKYFQIAPCFRDEDTRADRIFEFYQIDYEMAYATNEEVWEVSEYVIGNTFKDFADKDFQVDEFPFTRMTYDEAMRDYGSDKPDLRNPIKLKDVTEVFVDSSFSIFSKIAKNKGKILAIPAPKAFGKSRSWFDDLNKWARDNGMPGLGYVLWDDTSAKGPIAKFLSQDEMDKLFNICGLSMRDAVFFVAGNSSVVYPNAAKSRDKVAQELDIIDAKSYRFCWIYDFPFFEINDENKLDFAHNPFSMPQGKIEDLVEIMKNGSIKDKISLKALQYDLVCNGYEISSGGVRNHRPDLLLQAFESVGYEREEVQSKFSAILSAYKYGAPPHAGAAPGIDRIIMLLTQEPNLREVIAFPISQKGQDLMMGSPSKPTDIQLKELNLMIKNKK